MKIKIISGVICWSLITLFIYAAVSKLLEYRSFTSQIEKIPFLSKYSGILVWLVPSIEITLAALLFRGRTRLTGLYGSFFLMLFFSVYIFVLLHFGTYMLCSCGGIISKLSTKDHLWFNVAFTMLAGLGVCLEPSYSKRN